MIKCSKCKGAAITFIRYSGAHLCKEHFNEFFERRVKKEMRRQAVGANEHIVVALSGGKDSAVALYMLNKIFHNRKDVLLEAVTVDEGIEGYRNSSVKIARRLCDELKVNHYIISFREFVGHTVDEITNYCDPFTPCTYCGVFRRFCLNRKAREIGATKLATGHNLDDTVQSIIMNIFKGDIEKLARLGPHMPERVQKGLVPRLLPLRVIPEKEAYLYALINNIPIHNGECPYAGAAERNYYRELITNLEDHTPGTRHAILRGYDQLADALQAKFSPPPLNACVSCGEPTVGERCKSCELLNKLKQKIAGETGN
jgi:uncharacterized protein (TIGR00269 family)